MNPDKQLFVKLFFGNGEYKFMLRQLEIRELESLRGAGIGAIYKRMITGNYHNDDLIQIIRLGLVGGNEGTIAGQKVEVSPRNAHDLVTKYYETLPVVDRWTHANAVISALMLGISEDEAIASADEELVT